MKRELSYREEMVQQLHIVRGETNKAEGADTAALRHAFTFLDLHIRCRVFADVIDDARKGLCTQHVKVCRLSFRQGIRKYHKLT